VPEGHTVQRTANDFNRLFKGSTLEIVSPQGRFSGEAKLISGFQLKLARAIGKQLFLEFSNGLTLRIHLGIYGKWAFKAYDEELPEPFGQVRARFIGVDHFADLRGPTVCEVIDKAAVKAIENRLGPDPLNANPKGRESNRFIERVQRSKTPIGLLLMNQEVISGIGNVYRAEILFRAGISPHRPGNELSVEQINAIWEDSVDLMKVGVATGFMITRDELRKKKPTKAERNFVYKREGLPCRACGTNISIEIMATRKLYWCVKCQS
jgi:endonuclease-8